MRIDPSDAPTRRPETYPGDIPGHSYLLCGKQYARVEPILNRRLPQATVCDLDAGLVAEAASGRSLPLNFVLLRLNAATMNQRVPVLSVGSNAAPSQLALKFESRNVSSIVPVIRGRARALAIAYSAHLNKNGYLPAAPIHGDDARDLENAQVIFLDEEQLNAVDESEPNYTRVRIGSECYSIVLDNGEALSTCSIYQTRHGVIEPRIPALGPFFNAKDMTPQRDAVNELLQTEPALSELLGVRSYEDFRSEASLLSEKFGSILSELNLKKPDNLRITDSDAFTYGELMSKFETEDDHTSLKNSKLVLSTPRVVARHGEPIAQISTTTSMELGRPRHVAVVRRIEKRRYASHPLEIRVIAAVQEIDGEYDVVKLDQILRHALGLEIREKALIFPVQVASGGIGIVAPKRYVVMRVQVADINTVEQQACFMPQSELDLLGITSGDVVLLEGCVPVEGLDDKYEVPSIRLKAYAASEELIAQRERNAGGGFNARYPSARDALGVYPDLPWVFLDSGSRALLGVEKLGAVRIRAGRSYQLSKELRELMVLLLIASVGASTQISNAWVATTLFVASTIISILVVLLRMRVRLSVPPIPHRVMRATGSRDRTRIE